MDVGPKTRADARRNFAAVMTAAREAFAQHGADASMDDIARAAGVGKGTLYRHFETKDHLIAAILEEHFDQLAADAQRRLEDVASPGSALTEWLEGLDRGPTHLPGLRQRMSVVLANPDSTVQAACAPMKQHFGELFARAQAAGSVRSDIDATAVLDLVTGLPASGRRADGSSPYLPVILRGIRPDHL